MQNSDDSDTDLAADSETRRMATIGSIEPFDPSSGDWEAYEERLEMFLDANAVAEGQQVATLLTVIGKTAYKIVRNLFAPASPKDKTSTELKDALSAHFSPNNSLSPRGTAFISETSFQWSPLLRTLQSFADLPVTVTLGRIWTTVFMTGWCLV